MRGSVILAILSWLLLNPRAAAVCGDLTLDGVCDLSDLALLLASYGQHGGGDLDADGDTDLLDLADLLAHFGNSSPIPVSVDELIAPGILVPGSTFDLQFQVRNDGTCWTSYYPPFEIFWSSDDILSDDDFRIYGLALNLWLQAGETIPGEVNFLPVPCETPDGTGFVIVRMDWIGYISTAAAPATVAGGCD